MEAEGLLLPGAIIFLWIWAYYKVTKVSGPGAGMNFFIVLIVVTGVSVISFFVIVIPNEDCEGFLCSLDYLLFWLGLVALLLIIPPIVMLVRTSKKEKGLERKQNKKNQFL